MKYISEKNAQILNIQSPTFSLKGTHCQRVEQLMNMFDEAEEKLKKENFIHKKVKS